MPEGQEESSIPGLDISTQDSFPIMMTFISCQKALEDRDETNRDIIWTSCRVWKCAHTFLLLFASLFFVKTSPGMKTIDEDPETRNECYITTSATQVDRKSLNVIFRHNRTWCYSELGILLRNAFSTKTGVKNLRVSSFFHFVFVVKMMVVVWTVFASDHVVDTMDTWGHWLSCYFIMLLMLLMESDLVA